MIKVQPFVMLRVKSEFRNLNLKSKIVNGYSIFLFSLPLVGHALFEPVRGGFSFEIVVHVGLKLKGIV